MAKQQGYGVVSAAARVSNVQGSFQDRGEQFMTGYNKSLQKKKEQEQKNKETQSRVNSLMGGFKNDIDVLKFKPEDQTLVKNTIVGWRNQYAEAANIAAKIQDKSSAQYQEQMDIMNGIENRMSNLKNNLDQLAAFKGEYADNIKAGTYSNAGLNSAPLMQGEVMLNNAIGGINDNGDLTWSSKETGDFNFQDYEMPFEKAVGLATALGRIADPIRRQKTPLDNLQRKEIREKVESLASNPKALASLISDSDIAAFDFSNIDPEDPNAREEVVDLLVQSIYNLRGSGLAPTDTATATGGSAKKDRTPEYVEKLDAIFEMPGVPKTIGGVRVYYDPDVPMTDPEGERIQKGGFVYKGGGQTIVLSYDEMIDFLNS